MFFVQQLRKRTRDDDVPGLCPAALLQPLLQADDRLRRRDVHEQAELHVYLYLHAVRRHGRRHVDRKRQQLRQFLRVRLWLLPPVRLRRVRRVRQRGRRKQFRLLQRLRMQPLLRITTNFAGRETARQLLFLGGSGILSGIKEGSVCP